MNIKSILESLLFVSGEPMSFKKLAKIISLKEEELESAAFLLAEDYKNKDSGLCIIIKDGKIQMVTAGENGEFVEKFLNSDIEGELSRATLEVLSVVAYRGPIARLEIEEIRGVNCSFTLRHLMIRGLVERVNNQKDARAFLYKISFDFLKKLGIEKVENLPKFEELREKEVFKKPDNLNHNNQKQ